MRRLSLVLVALITTVIAIPASAAFADGGWTQISSRWSGKCIDMIRESGPGNGTLAQQWNCTHTPEQQFTALPVAGGLVMLENQRSARCLRPSEDSTLNNALIEQFDCNQADGGQLWQVFDPGGNSTGAKWLKNNSSGRCIEDSAWSGANGTLLTQSDCMFAWKDFWFGL